MTIETYLEFINLLCSFAYHCGMEAAKAGCPREIGELYQHPMTRLAWEAGYDEAPVN